MGGGRLKLLSSILQPQTRPSVFIVVLLVFHAVLVALCHAQTKWFKYEGNPVMEAGPKGEWDESIVLAPRVISVKDTLKMWYVGNSPATSRRGRIGYAWSTDGGFTWTKYPSNPVIIPTQSWDLGWTFSPYVIFTGTEYKMWYTGADGTGRIGYATSVDGIVWTMYAGNPVVDRGPLPWDARRIEWPSVVVDESGRGYKMWYAGYDSGLPSTASRATGFKAWNTGYDQRANYSVQIGYATAIDETTWTKADSENPVLSPGPPGSWEANSLKYPRVVFNGVVYEMWYGGGSGQLLDHQFGYATSPDGVNWTKESTNPVMQSGPNDWDAGGMNTPDVLFDGSVYHMWYCGHRDPPVGHIGYAISPKDGEVKVSPSHGFITPRKDSLRITVHAGDARGLAISATIREPQSSLTDLQWNRFGVPLLRETATLPLFDDGAHGDGLPGDGSFANSWIPNEEQLYFVDLTMKTHSKNRKFKMDFADAFTTIGPMKLERIDFLGDSTVHPGDTILVRLTLRNHGLSAAGASIKASLSSSDASIRAVTDSSLYYGHILPGETSTTERFYRIVVNPYAPGQTEAIMKVTISSWDIPLWYDEFSFRIHTPWWQTGWAYAVYVLVVVGLSASTIRYVEVRKLKRRIKQLEQEQAIERERTRISQDMHDEVGARLTEIGILSELVNKDIEDPRKAEIQIQKISETSREVIANIGEIIWAINTKNDSLDDLVAYLRQYASKYLGTAEIKCKFDIPDEVPTLHLSAEVRRNIFLVVKETLHNIVKHSGATAVQMQISFLSQNIEINIEDNGRGFNTEQPSRFRNGLRNMGKRMKDIGGTFEISSKPGEGTKATFGVEC